MKGKVKRLLATGFAFSLLATGALSASAAPTISEDFSDGIPFVALGDLDADGKLASSDLTMLRQILLSIDGVASKYADSNADGSVNVKDIVRLKKDIAALKNPAVIEDGVLKLNGKAYFANELVSLLKTDTEYQITYDVISEEGITIAVNGATEKVYTSGKGAKSFSHILKTGDSLTANSGLELSLSGVGTIDNIVISEITDTWTDGDSSEQGGNDIF